MTLFSKNNIERFVWLDYVDRYVSQLYRYIPFEQLKKVVETKTLYFARPFEEWEDTCEGYLFRELKNGDLSTKQEFLDTFPEDQRENVIKSINSCKDVRAMCWSYSKDDAELWSAYNYDAESVMYAVNKKELFGLTYSYNSLPDTVLQQIFTEKELSMLESSFDGLRKIPMIFQPIIYVSKLSLLDELEMLKDVFVNERGIEWSYDVILGRKREKYSFEKEIRLLIHVPFFSDEKARKGFVDIPNINKLIEGIMVNPKATDEFVEKVKSFCEKENLNFLGKSKNSQL